jgi:hypothetical protein
MPYRLLETLVPSVRLGGCPGRMMIVTQLFCCMLAAKGLTRLHDLRRGARLALSSILVVILLIESQPRLQATYPPDVPAWVNVVRDDPQPGALINLIARGHSGDLFAQTIHGRPIAFGDLARVSASTEQASDRIIEQVERGEFDALAQAGVAFIVIGRSEAPLPLTLVHEDRFSRVYRLDPKLR